MSRRTSTRRTRLGIGLEKAPAVPVGETDGDAVARPFLGRLAGGGDELDDHGDDASVRSYVITGGRSSGAPGSLAFETMLEATPLLDVHSPTLRFETRRIAELCVRDIVSVAEAAALLSLPLGVVQVLAGDLVADGLVAAHRPEGTFRYDVTFVRRLIDGIRAL